ncbi:MAG TPA: ATP-binding protein, partial [Rhizomicrobium sp.]
QLAERNTEVEAKNQEIEQARRALEEKAEELALTSKYKSEFLANMSHELRTPLNAILGFSDIIAEQVLGPDNPRYRDYARDINASGSHLLDLINDILDVAKIESGKMEIDAKPLDMSLTLAGIERQMALRVREKKLHLAVTIDADAPSPIADERAFKQIALNLISNAVKFTPEAGRIDVVCRRGENEGFLLAVEDSGQGIPPDKLDTVFDAFSQIDNRYDRKAGGTGLGLAMVQGLARLHGGNAWIESRVGQGTKVFVYFPLAIDRQRRAVSAHG